MTDQQIKYWQLQNEIFKAKTDRAYKEADLELKAYDIGAKTVINAIDAARAIVVGRGGIASLFN